MIRGKNCDLTEEEKKLNGATHEDAIEEIRPPTPPMIFPKEDTET